MNRETIWNVIHQLLVGTNYDLVQVVVQSDKEPHIQVLVENITTQTLSLEECSKMSDLIEQMLREKSLLDETQVLEISSPGLERPLVQHEHYQRYIGSRVCVEVRRSSSRDEKKRHGVLKGVLGSGIVLEVAKDEIISIDWSSIKICKLVYETKSLEDEDEFA